MSKDIKNQINKLNKKVDSIESKYKKQIFLDDSEVHAKIVSYLNRFERISDFFQVLEEALSKQAKSEIPALLSTATPKKAKVKKAEKTANPSVSTDAVEAEVAVVPTEPAAALEDEITPKAPKAPKAKKTQSKKSPKAATVKEEEVIPAPKAKKSGKNK